MSSGETPFERDPNVDHQPAHPSGWRLFTALLLAPIPPIFLFALFWRGDQEGSPGFVDGIFAGMLGAYPFVFFLGAPMLLILRHHARPTVKNALLAGATVASAPWWLMALASGDSSTVKYLALPSTLFGLFGGLVFYWIGVYRPPRSCCRRKTTIQSLLL